MNDVWLKTSLIGLNLALVTIAACSAEDSTPAPKGGTATNNNTGGANATVVGGILPQGGTPPGTAGSKASGSAGTSPSAGTNPITGGTGVGGSGTTVAMPCTNKPAAAAPLIDDAEDADNGSSLVVALMTGSYWFTYNDGTGMQTPAPDPMGLNPLIPTAGGSTSPKFSIRTNGTAHLTWGAGLGLTLNQDQGGGGQKCTLDASAYQGIKFQAKSAAGEQVRVKVGVPGTVGAADGGTCAAMCDDFGQAVLLTTAWAEYQVPFAGITQEGWGTPATFSAASIMQVQFQVGKGLAFDFSIDDLSFY